MHIFHKWSNWKPSTATDKDGNKSWQYRECKICKKIKVVSL